MEHNDVILRVRDFCFAYPEQTVNALDHMDLAVHKGDFLVLCGVSGCGKTTLLRQLKTALAPHGVRSGEILLDGTPLEDVDLRTQTMRIGFVQQAPEAQIVTDKVWHELAFGMESLGFDTPTIRRRVAEMASFFGIQNWFYRDVSTLSGGQMQLLNLAAVMTMAPEVLILDEPTSQLDPIAASDFLQVLGRINRELGTTVIMTEHRLEEVFPLATKVAVVEKGRLLCEGAPAQVAEQLALRQHRMHRAMPTPMRVWHTVGSDKPCPVTVREGRDWLRDFAASHTLLPIPAEEYLCGEEIVLCAEELWFRYDKDSPDVVKGLSLQVQRGEWLALMGGNGTGKSTTLKLLGGLLTPQRGSVSRRGTVGILPQDPKALFLKKTVRDDLAEILCRSALSKEEQGKKLAEAVALCDLYELLERHPYDLSGGEQQRAALAKILLLEPEILLLDEPTKGLDADFKDSLAGILQTLTEKGMTVVMVSHDVEFCAQYAHRCAMMFDGSIVNSGMTRAFFSGNSFYTTSANRMARELLPEAITAEDIIASCGAQPEREPRAEKPIQAVSLCAEDKRKWLPLWRKLTAAVATLVAVGVMIHCAVVTDLSALISGNRLTSLGWAELARYGVLIAALIILALAIGQRSKKADTVQLTHRGRLSKRTVAAAIAILLLIPLTLYAGSHWFGDRKYYLVSILILAECMLPFFLVFEGRKPKARELVIIAVLCALGVAGRAALFMLPNFKPVLALTIIAGVAFGGEAGFLVGSMTMLVSNIMFSQGPWTPWQMFSMGIIGFLAGIVFSKGALRPKRGSLCVFGALSAIIIYGGIMNGASALMWTDNINLKTMLTYYVTGFPVDCVHASATALFLWFGAEPMLEKLERIKVKYGLVEM